MTPHSAQFLSSYLLISILLFVSFILYVLVSTLGWRFTYFLKLLAHCVGVTKREGKAQNGAHAVKLVYFS